jgi:hypothetical protein
MRRTNRIAFTFITAMSMSFTALAADKACLLEGTVTLFGTTKEVKDCLQNTGVTEAVLKEICQQVSNMAVQAGAAPAKITYLNECPKPSQASCAGFFGQPMTSYYYKRTEKLLANSKKSCEMQGGKWN